MKGDVICVPELCKDPESSVARDALAQSTLVLWTTNMKNRLDKLYHGLYI